MLASSLADLRRAGVATILAGQSPSGGYVACPTFPPYRFSWLRDGAFIADAMSRVGEVESAERFFDWVAGIVERGLGFEARYTLDGERDPSDWPHRQHDGWGLWLWALREHAVRHGGGGRWREAAAATAAHLERVRDEPCVDWWEEREGVHAATLACIAAGLGDDLDLSRAEERLDGSLLVLPFLGFGTVDVAPLVSPGGGVHRHLEDVYYGGGEWLLLTAMLGLAEPERGEELLEWIAAHAGPGGTLPEQSQDHLLHPDEFDVWVAKWGSPPSPLLWSHAMFLTLDHALHGG
ncbi:MAG TPA: glycoside hydrolase family 15 protein [Gaiellaceae bacterium]|nr:glycoside hydrolase family 15 protein [Gaiellaceae bacterium]